MGFILLVVAALAGAQPTSAGGRVALPSASPEWAEVTGNEGIRGFVDRRSIRVENGAIRYVGRTVFPRPDEHGVLELVHVGEIDCARRDYRTVAFDALGPGGAVVSSYTVPAEEPPVAINAGSNNEALHTEFCR